MADTIFEIKEHYTSDEVQQIYRPLTIMMTRVADVDTAFVPLLNRAVLDYVNLLSPDLDVAVSDTAFEALPHTLWGRVPHTLPMMVYRVYSLMTHFNEYLPGRLRISEDFTDFLYQPAAVVNKYVDMVKTAESILKQQGDDRS